jgi:hypothetical protein
MLRSLLLAAAATLALALPSAAATVFSTDFSTDTPGLNVVPNGFTVTGQVDIVADGTFGITTPGGNVVDLDGSPGPGEIVSASTYAFSAGDTVTLSFVVGGSQRSSALDDIFFRLIFGAETEIANVSGFGFFDYLSQPSLSVLSLTAGNQIAGADPYTLSGATFTAVTAGTLGFGIGTTSADNIGPLVASVALDIAPIPLPAAGGALVLGLGLLAALRRKRA